MGSIVFHCVVLSVLVYLSSLTLIIGIQINLLRHIYVRELLGIEKMKKRKGFIYSISFIESIVLNIMFNSSFP